MTLSWSERQHMVSARARQRCAYCQMHQELQGALLHVEHIVPRRLGGSDELDNLAWACPGRHLSKGMRVTVRDPLTGHEIGVFHPRQDRWAEHFAWEGYALIGLTSLGRAVVVHFNLNHVRCLRVCQVEERFS